MSLLGTGRLRAAQQNNLAAGKDPTTDEAQQGWLDKLRTLVPTDAVTAYVALIGATSALAVGWRIAALALIAVLTPGLVVVSYLDKADEAAKDQVRYPIFDATVGLLAFTGVAALIGLRLFKRGTPPKPELAIEEAQKTRAVLEEVRH